ncbi:ABC-2 family transporter protein [Vallitalea pronyensis]|uniref:ABC-2 family transporter protein n=1 Tax=Vallitalea pronyensis TaxID=1348613 RepID=A0A8J8MLA8_9FIRM|nr:ABC-2 family transporter protein [Vallitalea pronyensis]QUI23840.1 ABC-2 family transporter protein [Vallitalea pronyensis]
MYYLNLYSRYIIVYLKSKIEYRFSFFMDIFVQIFTYIINYASIWLILNKFSDILGWSFYEIMFLYNLNLFTYGLCGLFFWSPMRALGTMIQQGTFDSLLIRPMNPFLNLICKQFNHAFIGHIILGLIVFSISLNKLQIIWNFKFIILFMLIIIGGVLIQASMMIITASISFWFVKSTALTDTIIYGFRDFVNYPINIYNKFIKIILTFVIPYAFVNFYPVQYFLNIKENVVYHQLFIYGTPLIGIITFAMSLLIWKFGMNRYQSTGS